MTNLMKPPPELQRGYKDIKHLGKVAELPCVACQKRGEAQTSKTQVHHEWGKGAGKKASDRLTMPLCDKCHNAQFVNSIKGITLHHNLEKFEERHGTQSELIKLTYENLGLFEELEIINKHYDRIEQGLCQD